MRVTIDARMLGATGIGRYTRNLLRELLRLAAGDDEYVIFVRSADVGLIPEGIHARVVVCDYEWYSLGEQLGLASAIRMTKPDLVHFPHFNVPLAYRGPYVVTIHDLTLHRFRNVRGSSALYSIRQAIYRVVFWNAVRRARGIVVPSQSTKDDLVATMGVAPEKITVTREGGPDETSWASEASSDVLQRLGLQGRPFVLNVGTAFPHKNLSILIDALTLLPSEYRLVLVGKQDEFRERLGSYARESGLCERVLFPGYVSDADLAALYGSAEVFAFPSLNEGFGLPGLEAMAFGAPVVASNAPCLPEILGEAALYFDPSSPEACAAAVMSIAGESELRAGQVSRGRERLAHFSWEDTARSTLEVYCAVLRAHMKER